jgi:hypothetical protein
MEGGDVVTNSTRVRSRRPNMRAGRRLPLSPAGAYRGRTKLRFVVALSAAVVMLAVSASPAAATVTISGHVYGADTGSTGISGAVVNLDTASAPETALGSTTAGSGGSYSFSGLAAGSYKVDAATGATDAAGPPYYTGGLLNYLPRFYTGSPTWLNATAVNLPTDGQTVSNVDIALPVGGEITGTVSLPGATATLYDPDGITQTVSATGSYSTYSFIRLETGSYRVCFEPPFGDTQHVSQCYNGKAGLQAADPISVIAGSTNTNIDAAFQSYGAITGKVTDASTGAAIGGLVVGYYDAASGAPESSTKTAADGTYTLTKVAPGTWKVVFVDTNNVYTTQYYNGQPTLACANAVTVGDGATVASVNAAMSTAPAGTACAGGGSGGGGSGGGSGSGTGGTGGGTGGTGGIGGSGTPGAGATVSLLQILAQLKLDIAPSGKAAAIGALLKAGGFALAFKALTGGIAVVDWYRVPAGAHVAKAGSRPKPVLVASGRLSFSAAGTRRLKLKLTAAGRNLLAHAKHLKLTGKGTFTPAGRPAVSARRSFVLKR